ncbi:MAG: substrate-binding domain-containing protein [Deltaproteobacteria bacterium]|nr:substrate-binding domain-containing protein [Deltaproteobacteria bacterium]
MLRNEWLFGLILLLVVWTLPLFPGSASAEPMTPWEKARAATFAKLGEVPRPDAPLKIGTVLVTLSNPFWVSMKEGYENAAREFGVTIDVQAAPQENSVANQLNILENMVAKDYDALCAHTITARNLIPAFVKAARKGIPVVSDNRVDLAAAHEAGAEPITLGLVDFYGQGRLGAEYIARTLSEKGGGKVAIIEGLPGAPQSEARTRGAKDAFEAFPDVEMVSSQPGNWDRAKAFSVTQNLIQAHPDLAGIQCANDIMALAAVEAIEAAGKTGRIMVVGIDLIPQGKEAIRQGRLAGSVAFSPFVIGETVARAAIAAAQGLKIPEDLEVVSVLATKDNIGRLADWK